ncbi:TetR/AcrR family transcriptional regulator [Methylorubrum populi]|uniref:TetR/AcrR family transcriptional regulator n=1 Tax=Methylorubrum rhodesianum TaxID=29427 RepID=A0ABU9ZE22_9HYPH|nr:TetR/AcrR family transcriptional regulator [Methylorubrum rhodesianum]MBK3404774.1 TetR/AcrR family transcriptional regulator [Methylorubrum rhodesianum]MBY0142849.1 TetR/AcrR family transcriptional regulator [Methylorubrum populi]
MARTVAERSDVLPLLAEVFREHGYEGASLSLISKATGLGKGSLYHFFPGGKEEMAVAVLAEIDGWFEANVFRPLRETNDPRAAVATMFATTAEYFRSGRRVCLVGALSLSDARDRFAGRLRDYFARWVEALTAALARAGHGPEAAGAIAEEAVGGIQGAVVLARALDRPDVFEQILTGLRARCLGTA